MPNNPSSLPEGTDSIIIGASAPAPETDVFVPAATPAGDTFAGEVSGLGGTSGLGEPVALGAHAGLREQAGERAAALRGQAGDKARDFAEQGKERATSALDSVARMIDDAAVQVDEKVGPEYGDYARRAADAVDGLASNLRHKDVDALFADARELVRRSPGLAIGAAAVVGFALVRLIKSGVPAEPGGTGREGPTASAPS